MSLQVAKKIAAITLLEKIGTQKEIAKLMTADNAEPIYIGRIFGVVDKIDAVQTQFGEATKFVGEFAAVDIDGLQTASNVCYLPDVATGLLKNAYMGAAKNSGGEISSVEFGFDLSIAPAKREGGAAYEFRVNVLHEQSAEQSRLGFASKFALPAPKTEQEPKAKK